jgi:hypothetical protein
MGLIKLVGCVDFAPDLPEVHNYMSVMMLTKLQCQTLFGGIPEQETAYLVTKIDSHTPVWERVDEDLELMEFHNRKLRKARIVEE